MLALVIVIYQRFVIDDGCDFVDAIGRDAHRRQRACSDGVRLDHRADPRDQLLIAQPDERGDRRVLVQSRGLSDDGKWLLDQREIPLPSIQQGEFGGGRGHCPIRVARAVKKMPEGSLAVSSAFLAKVAVS